MTDFNKNILITPNKGQLDDPIITFVGKNNTTIKLKVLNDGTLSFEGSNGQIFGITDTLNGTVFAVNNNNGIPVLEINNDGLLKLSEFSNNILIGTNVNNFIDKLQVNGSINHKGLSFSYGTNIDQLLTITRTLTLTTDWQDTGITADHLESGTYLIQLYAHDISVGGFNNNEYYSGIMSWFSLSTNSESELPTDEIVLHRAGASSGDTGIYLRTYRINSNFLKLQIYSNSNNTSSANYIFKFRRVI